MSSRSQLKVFLAGRAAVEANGHVIDESRFPGRQGRLLFAYLVAERGRPVPRDELAEALWGDAPPATWDKALTVIASKLRGLLADVGAEGGSALTSAFGCYRLELPEGTWVDVIVAGDAAQEAEEALVAGDEDKAKAQATLAASLVERPFLPGDDGTWVDGKRRELTEIRVRALSVLAEACLRSGAASEATKWAEQAIALEPFRETGYRRLMEAHVAAGNRAEALRVYERCRRLLAEELGAYPSPETESIYRGLLEGPGRVEERAAPETPPPETGRPRAGRRRRAALAAAALILAGAIAATLAMETRGGPPPKVLPDSVVRIDPDTKKVKQVVSVGDAPDLVVAAGGFVWITNHVLRDFDSWTLRNAGDRTLTRVDPSTGKAVVVGGGLAPCGLTADPSGDVWVANCYPANAGPRDNVVRIDAKTLDFTATWPVPAGDGFYRGLAYGGGSLWVSQIFGGVYPNANILTKVDPATGAHRRIHLARPAVGLAWSEGYGDLWTNNFDEGSVTRLHEATGAVKTVDRVAVRPGFPVVDGDTVWVGDWTGPQVVRLRAVGSARPTQIPLPMRNFAGVWNIAAGAGAIWATTPRDRALWRIDPKTNAVTRLRMRYLPTEVAVDANDVWVTLRER
jgi:DNA-binding SARP family transcriptional activator/streptogramin lyase